MKGLFIIIVITVITVSCSTAEKKTSDGQTVSGNKKTEKHELTAKGGKLEFDAKKFVIKKYDINKDKKPDIINVFKKVPVESGKRGDYDLQISVKMMDLNRDTKIDVWRFFDEKGAVTKEELDLDFDGKIDAVDYYLSGIVRRREVDFQFDEKTDVWKYFDEKGKLMRFEADQTGDGKPDYWEHYKNAVIERIEKDTDGDGKPDIFKRSGDKDFTRNMNTTDKFEGESVKEEIKEKPEDEIKETSEEKTEEKTENKSEKKSEEPPKTSDDELGNDKDAPKESDNNDAGITEEAGE